jgi:hypothetical protein
MPPTATPPRRLFDSPPFSRAASSPTGTHLQGQTKACAGQIQLGVTTISSPAIAVAGEEMAMKRRTAILVYVSLDKHMGLYNFSMGLRIIILKGYRAISAVLVFPFI